MSRLDMVSRFIVSLIPLAILAVGIRVLVGGWPEGDYAFWWALGFLMCELLRKHGSASRYEERDPYE